MIDMALILRSLVYIFLISSVALSKEIKITPGVDRYINQDLNVLEYEEPKPYWGPPAAYFLKGSCFVGLSGTTEYTVCPFQNVTQRRSGSFRSILLGVWEEWMIPESSLKEFNDPEVLTMSVRLVNSSYTNGARCGGPKNIHKSTVVEFGCINGTESGESFSDFEVAEITDKDACRYYVRYVNTLVCYFIIPWYLTEQL